MASSLGGAVGSACHSDFYHDSSERQLPRLKPRKDIDMLFVTEKFEAQGQSRCLNEALSSINEFGRYLQTE